MPTYLHVYYISMRTTEMKDKGKVLLSLKKAKGTVDKVMQMVEEGRYCADVAQQINAAIGLLKNANNELLKSHLMCCGKQQLGSSDPQKVATFVDELIRVWDVSTRK